MRCTPVSHVHTRRTQSQDVGRHIFKFNSIDTIFQLDVHWLIHVQASYSYDVNCVRVIFLTFTLSGSGRTFHRAHLSHFNSGRLQNLIFIRASPYLELSVLLTPPNSPPTPPPWQPTKTQISKRVIKDPSKRHSVGKSSCFLFHRTRKHADLRLKITQVELWRK